MNMAEATSQVPLSKGLFALFAQNGYRKPAEQCRTQQHSDEFVIVGAHVATQIFICLEADALQPVPKMAIQAV